MKKQVLKLGKVLGKTKQKEILGGGKPIKGVNQCYNDSDCCNHQHNHSYGYVCFGATPGGPGVCVPGVFGENPCGL